VLIERSRDEPAMRKILSNDPNHRFDLIGVAAFLPRVEMRPIIPTRIEREQVSQLYRSATCFSNEAD
jgi:hypothetical protein